MQHSLELHLMQLEPNLIYILLALTYLTQCVQISIMKRRGKKKTLYCQLGLSCWVFICFVTEQLSSPLPIFIFQIEIESSERRIDVTVYSWSCGGWIINCLYDSWNFSLHRKTFCYQRFLLLFSMDFLRVLVFSHIKKEKKKRKKEKEKKRVLLFQRFYCGYILTLILNKV